MKRTYRFSDGELIVADKMRLRQLLKDYECYLQNYTDIDLASPEYIARGNGFCESKYSENFIENQIEKYRHRINDIQSWLQHSDRSASTR